MKHKHLIAIFLVMTMVVGMLPTCVFAKDEDVEVHWFEGSQNAKDEDPSVEIPPQTDKEEKPSDNDELFKGYIENRLEKEKVNAKPQFRKRSIPSGNGLTTYNRNLYNALKPQIAAVAAGEKTSTEFNVSYTEMGFTSIDWSAADLGISAITDSNGTITDEAKDAVAKKINLSLRLVDLALLADCPFDFYWFDKTQGAYITRYTYYYNKSHVYFKEGTITVSYTVADAYAKDTFEVDTSKIDRVNKAIATAKSVVSSAIDLTDYEKLKSYKDWICDKVSYDYSALGGSVSYGDPWQLISVFDGDSTTNVVCEGYSKAFMYLCELTVFDTDVQCITVTGETNGGHMWNIVNMEDGKNYLVDVTNCDYGTSGYPNLLFLVGCISGNRANGYTFKTNNSSGKLTYKYDTETLSIYDEELYISTSNYVPKVTSGTCGTSLKWTLSNGILKITGTGRMTDWTSSTACPWNGNKSNITKIVISDGVTSIGNYAFSGCTNLTEVSISESVTSIGNYAFANCPAITTVNFGGTRLEWNVVSIGTGNENLTGATVKYALLSVTLDEYSGGTASVSKTKGASGDLITITAVPDAGYDLVSIELNGSLLTGTNEFALEGLDVTVKVTFAKHILTKMDKKPATCTEDGYEEYYVCSRCKKLFSDPEGTKEISAPVVITHSGHKWDKGTQTKEPTCDEKGEMTYACTNEGCHETYTDSIPALGHDLKEIPEKPATKQEAGHITYYECQRCHKLFSDDKGEHEIKISDTVIPQLTHDLTKVPANPATCTTAGNYEYYVCKDSECGCNHLYSDKYGQHELKPEDVVDPVKGHDLDEHKGVAATCTEAGYETYYRCKRCGKYFSDPDGKNEISGPVVIPALGHDKDHLEHHEYKAPTRDNDGNKEYWKCTRPGCGKCFSDADCQHEFKPVEIIIPAIGAAKLGEEAKVDGLKYVVTNPSTDGTGTVTLMGVENPMEKVSIPATVEYKETIYKVNRIGAKAFYGDKIVKTVTIGSNVLIIDANAFYGCSNLVKVSGGASLKTIGTNAFARCSKLSTFVITSKVLYKIGVTAFYKDSKLKTLYIKNTTKLTKSGVKKSLKGSKVKTVKVKKSKVKKYRSYFKKKNSGKFVKVKK